MAASAVRVHSVKPAVDIAPDHVYYAFGSGRFSYDCNACGAHCCRGFGYLATTDSELRSQIATRRALPLFAFPDGDGNPLQHRVRNCAPGCFFLDESGLCEIHVERGSAAKPETCRLFPFNCLRRFGSYLIVLPHESLCPLSVVSGTATSVHSDHSVLFDDMSSAGLYSPVPIYDPRGRDVDAVIELERRIIRLAESRRSWSHYVDFAREQLQLTLAFRGDSSGASSSVEDVFRLSGDLLGLEAARQGAPDSNLIEALVATTPTLRWRLLCPDPIGPHSPTMAPLDPRRVPHALVVIYVICLLAREAGMKRITFQSISRLDLELRPLIRVLALADASVAWKQDAPVAPVGFADPAQRARYLGVARALLPAYQHRRRSALAHILHDHAPSEPLARMLFLKHTAANLVEKVTLDPHERWSGEGVTLIDRIRSRIHRWMLANANDDSMDVVTRHMS
jgi:Fe-S-cluster containining protein